MILQANVMLGELFFDSPIPSFETVEAWSRSSHFATYIPPLFRILWDKWNRYLPDEYHNQYPEVGDLPMLLLNGELDMATPIYLASWDALHYNHSNQVFVAIPLAAHITMFTSPGR